MRVEVDCGTEVIMRLRTVVFFKGNDIIINQFITGNDVTDNSFLPTDLQAYSIVQGINLAWSVMTIVSSTISCYDKYSILIL